MAIADMTSKMREIAAFDTSVWINLFATGITDQIIEAVGYSVLLPFQIKRELRRDPVTGKPFDKHDHPVSHIPFVQEIRFSSEEADLFVELVGGTHISGLGDGEAAAIVLGACRNALVAIDESKGRALIRKRFPMIQTMRSVEILRHPSVVGRIGANKAAACFNSAVEFGRMHVPK